MKIEWVIGLLAIGTVAYLLLKLFKTNKPVAIGASATVPGGGSSEMIAATAKLDSSELPELSPSFAKPGAEVPSLSSFIPLSHKGDGGSAIPGAY